MEDRQKNARLVAIALLALVLLNGPLLSVADSDARVLGVPVLVAYLFTAWALVIALLALIVRKSG
jgi:hypothetical protein